MSQLVRVSGDYGIKVDAGSSITLDTGNFAGEVIITGDLVVRGGSTSIETTELKVTDKIIYLNVTEIVEGDEPAGILGDGKAGIDIYRGILPDAKLLFDENISWYNPLTDTTDSGSWIFVDDNERLQPLRVASLSSSALTDFVIDLRDGPGVLRLVNSDAQLYSDSINDDLDDSNNKIPNVRTLRDYVGSGNLSQGVADVDKIYFSLDSGQTISSRVQANQSSIEFYISEGLLAQLTSGALDLYTDVNIRGSNLDTSASVFNLVNTNAELVNFAGAASSITIGSLNGGTTTVRHNLNVAGDVNVGGGDLTAAPGAFNLVDTNVTTVNFAGDAIAINIGNTAGTTSINHNLIVGGSELAVERSTFNLVNTNATTVNFAGAANYIEIGSAFGSTKLNHSLEITGDLKVNGGDLTTDATTFNLVNTTATTVNFAGVATNIQIGSFAGTTNINNDLDVDGDVNIAGGDLTVSTGTFSLANTTATTVNFAGAATIVEIGSATGTTTVNNNLVVELDLSVNGGDLTTTSAAFNLVNATATTVNFAGAATEINIGNASGTTVINNDLAVNGGDLITDATTFNLVDTTATVINFAGDATEINIGAGTGFTDIKNNLNVTGDLDIDGGDLTVSTTTFNLANTVANAVNFAGAATLVNIGSTTGTTTVNNNLVVELDLSVNGGDLTTNQTIFNLLNTTATTVNAFSDATAVNIGAITGTTTINNDLDVDGDVNIAGGDLTVSTGTFSLANTTATTVNFAGAATIVEIGSATGTTNVNNNLVVDLDVEIKGGDLTTDQTTFNLLNTAATTVNFAGDATEINIGSATGITTVNNNLDVIGDLDIGGGDITTAQLTFNLLNTAATTVNFAGDATEINVGSSTGTMTVNNDLDVKGNLYVYGFDDSTAGLIETNATTFDLLNSNAIAVNFAGDATEINIGADIGTTTVNNDLAVSGNLYVYGFDDSTVGLLETDSQQFNLINTNAITVNFAGDATEINIGTEAGSTTINDINITGNVISSVTSNDLLFDGVLALSNQASVPLSQPGYVKLYSTNDEGGGGTGLYFVNTIGTNDELISRSKAFIYSLIL